MVLRCWLLVFSRHRDLWFGVEFTGSDMALAGGLISNLSGKPTFLSVLLNDGWVAAYDPNLPLYQLRIVLNCMIR